MQLRVCSKFNSYIYTPVLLLIVLFTLIIYSRNDYSIKYSHLQTVTKSDILLVYVYADTHSYARGNLEYFIRTAVRNDDGVHYYFILQQTNNVSVNISELPHLSSNAWYIQHENKCFDIGTVGWFLRTHFGTNQTLDLTTYQYFIFMNSSIRGPFFPPYYWFFLTTYKNGRKEKIYWYSIFTQRLNDKVKLVGCTISCQFTPHVQSYFLVTDSTGLALLMYSEKEKNIFDCYDSLAAVTSYSELAASTRILNNGLMIDSLQTKYQGVDFNQKENGNCNGGLNPYFDRAVDGLTLDPYEVIFVKFNYKAYKEAADRASVYQKWMTHSNFSKKYKL